MFNKIYNLYSKLILNNDNYARVLAFSILIFIIIFVLIISTLEPVKHSKEYEFYKNKKNDEK
jgi:hypothetical protein